MALPNKAAMPFDQHTSMSLNRKAAENLAYATQCYQIDDHSRPDSCRAMTVPALPITVNSNASCPFAENMCKQTSGNLFLDTGVLDSYTHFGLNAGPHVSVQVKEHCAPIITTGFAKSSVEPSRGNVNFTRYYYGGGYFNHTFEVANNATPYTSDGTGNYEVQYVIMSLDMRPFFTGTDHGIALRYSGTKKIHSYLNFSQPRHDQYCIS